MYTANLLNAYDLFHVYMGNNSNAYGEFLNWIWQIAYIHWVFLSSFSPPWRPTHWMLQNTDSKWQFGLFKILIDYKNNNEKQILKNTTL